MFWIWLVDTSSRTKWKHFHLMFLTSGGGWSGYSGLSGVAGTPGSNFVYSTQALCTVISQTGSGLGPWMDWGLWISGCTGRNTSSSIMLYWVWPGILQSSAQAPKVLVRQDACVHLWCYPHSSVKLANSCALLDHGSRFSLGRPSMLSGC